MFKKRKKPDLVFLGIKFILKKVYKCIDNMSDEKKLNIQSNPLRNTSTFQKLYSRTMLEN